MNKWIKTLLVVAFLGSLGYFGGKEMLRSDPIVVAVFEVERGLVEDTVTNTKAGTVRARSRAKISPEIAGRVVNIGYREGDRVRAGDILMRLDESEYRAGHELAGNDLQVALSRENEACLSADQTLRELERNRRLLQDGIVSEDIIDRLQDSHDLATAACGSSKSQVARAKTAVGLAAVNLAKTIVRAPFSAIVAEVNVELGELASPTSPAYPIPPAFDLYDPRTIYVSSPIDEVDVAKISPGMLVRISLDPFPNRHFAGLIEKVTPYVLDIEEQNRTVEIEVTLKDNDFAATLLPGLSADAEVILSQRENVLRIPSYSLIESKRVFVVVDQKIVTRPVEIGLRNWDFTEVLGGLEEGELVITSLDLAGVKDGAEVTIGEEISN